MSTTKLNECFITVVGNVGKPAVDIKRWVENAGGIFQTNLTRDTTHLIVSEDKWKAGAAPVMKALHEEDVHVVSYDWLDDTLRHTKGSRRKPEKKYYWETLDAKTMKKYQARAASDKKAIQVKNKKAEREAERDRKKAIKEKEKKEKAKSKISYVAALTEHTDAFMTPAERVAHAEAIGKKKAAASDSGSASPSAATSKASSKFRQGAKAAKQDLFSANHHVYMDMTGFHYDVVLSKVDLTSNSNERHILTIYETNSDPHSYTTFLKSSGTSGPTKASVLTQPGTNYGTAFRIFRKKFQELTTVEWDDRVQTFERVGRGSGSRGSTGGSGRGAPKVKLDFKDMPFIYRLPPLGEPRGVMPPVAGGFDLNYPVQSIEQGSQQHTVDEEEEDEDERPRNGRGRRRAAVNNSQVSSSASTVEDEQLSQGAQVNRDVVMQDGSNDTYQNSQVPAYSTFDLAMHAASNNSIQSGPSGVYYDFTPTMQEDSNPTV